MNWIVRVQVIPKSYVLFFLLVVCCFIFITPLIPDRLSPILLIGTFVTAISFFIEATWNNYQKLYLIRPGIIVLSLSFLLTAVWVIEKVT